MTLSPLLSNRLSISFSTILSVVVVVFFRMMASSAALCALLVLANIVAAFGQRREPSTGNPLPQEVYWNTVLPKSTMPDVLRHLLHAEVKNPYNMEGERSSPSDRFKWLLFDRAWEQNKVDPNDGDYILYKDLHPGTKMPMHVLTSTARTGFLPRTEADSMPFSLSGIPEIFARFSVQPHSIEAKIIKKSIDICHLPPDMGDRRQCATSLESMVEFAVTTLGSFKIKATSTRAIKETSVTKQDHTISKKVRMEGNKAVVCHPLSYPYAVYYCHVSHGTRVFKVVAIGEDGTVVDAVATCHMETGHWSPEHPSMLVLKEKPGAPVCHFLPKDNVIWTPTEEENGDAATVLPA